MHSVNNTGMTLYVAFIFGFGETNQQRQALLLKIETGTNSMANLANWGYNTDPDGKPTGDKVPFANKDYYINNWNRNSSFGVLYSQWDFLKPGDVVVLCQSIPNAYIMELFTSRKGHYFDKIGMEDDAVELFIK